MFLRIFVLFHCNLPEFCFSADGRVLLPDQAALRTCYREPDGELLQWDKEDGIQLADRDGRGQQGESGRLKGGEDISSSRHNYYMVLFFIAEEGKHSPEALPFWNQLLFHLFHVNKTV